MTSSPLRPGASLEEELNYYKKQYEQLETDLADFQASSKELEEQLERDVENAEKRERKLKEQVEKLTFETEEWKAKHKQSKTEGNSAQNALQKEITAIRESNRTMQLKLRDIEVTNDDYERQARNTESSLEDMESKYNVAIERGVILEDEVKSGEQEREALRIEAQRLRDELADLKIEHDITLEKARRADETIARLRSRKPSPLAVESLRNRSPGSEASGVTPSSPTASTPPPKSDSASDAPTPPSPPLSDAPTNAKQDPKTPLLKRRSLLPEAGTTPRAGLYPSRTQPKHSRGPSAVSSSSAATSDAKGMRPPASRPRQVSRPSNLGTEGLPRSESLLQIRNLRGRMQKIEERVHSARSKLPAPKGGTPKGSPRTTPSANEHLPTSVTMRRSMKRPSSNIGSAIEDTSSGASGTPSRRDSQVSRLSFGIPRPPSAATDRPGSAFDRPPSAAAANRPTSRTSLVHGFATISANRPSSRAGARSAFGAHQPPSESPSATAFPARSSSSVGTYATVRGTPRSHRQSASISDISPTRKSVFDTGWAKPSGTSKRQSGGIPQPRSSVKRPSIGFGQEGAMPPPPRRKMSDVGETF